MGNDQTSVVKILPAHPSVLLPDPRRVVPGAVFTDSEQGEPLRDVVRMVELLRGPARPRVAGPVLVARAGSPLEQMLPALVYPVGSRVSDAAPQAARLPDEVMRFCIGRTSANDIVTDDLTVSKRHASLVRMREDRWAIVDEGSSNGTFLDGRKLRAREPELVGTLSTLRFGPNARFAFMHPEVFLQYLDQLRAEHARRGVAIIAERIPARETFDAVRHTSSGGSHEPLAARLIALLRRAPALVGYEIHLEPNSVHEVATLSEALAVVEKHPSLVRGIEGKTEDGRRETLYRRETVTGQDETARIPA